MFDLSGLQSLKQLADDIESGMNLKAIDIDDIVSEAQVRKNFSDIEQLANSIQSEGLQQPINVYKRSDDKYVIIQGERRWRACKFLGLKTIDAIVREKPKEDKDKSIVQLVENVQRQEMDAFEISDAIAHLVLDHNMRQKIIADRIGWSTEKVARYFALAQLKPTIREAVKKLNAKDILALQEICKVNDNEEKTLQALNTLIETGEPLNRKNAKQIAKFVLGKVDSILEDPQSPIQETTQPVSQEANHDLKSDSGFTETAMPTETNSVSSVSADRDPEQEAIAEIPSNEPVKESKRKQTKGPNLFLPDDVKTVPMHSHVLKVAVQLEDEMMLVGFIAPNLECSNSEKVCVISKGKVYTFMNHQIVVVGWVPAETFAN